MAQASDPDPAAVDRFFEEHVSEEPATWDRSYNKKQCPDCGGLHGESASECSACGWSP